MAAKPKSSEENGAVQATDVPPNKVSLCSTLSDAQESVIREIISRATDKWSLGALSELAGDGPLRFSRLMDRVDGVSQTHPLWMWCALNLSGFDRARTAFDRRAQSARAKSKVSAKF